MANSGDPCEKCGHRIRVLNSIVLPTNRVRYIGCPVCGWRPSDNKHVVPLRFAPPRSVGEPNHNHNRVASCTVCDRVKDNAVVDDIEAARQLIARKRAGRLKWFEELRTIVRDGQEGGS